MQIKRVTGEDDRIGDFISEAFSDYSISKNVDLNYEEYCFIAENDKGEIIGAVTGRAYYNEVHIGDLIIDKEYRGHQAPEFYKKLGYTLEYVREDKNPKLSKYFYLKEI